MIADNTWMTAEERNHIIFENIGENNDIKAMRYTDAHNHVVAYIEHEGKVRSAYYKTKKHQNNNIDYKKAKVKCNAYNKVLADFIKNTIMKYKR